MEVTRDWADSFVEAHINLMTAVWSAIWAYQNAPDPVWEETVQVWIQRVCDNLHRTHARIKDARDAFVDGSDPDPIRHYALVQLGLSRDLNEFDLEWARPEYVEAIDNAVDRLIGMARMVTG